MQKIRKKSPRLRRKRGWILFNYFAIFTLVFMPFLGSFLRCCGIRSACSHTCF